MRAGVALVCALASLAWCSAAAGMGETYGVVECGALNREATDAVQKDSPEYAVKDYCADAANDDAFSIRSRHLAVQGKRGLVRIPTRSGALGIVGVRLDAKLRGDKGSHPRIWLADRNLGELAHVATTDSPGDGFHHYAWSTDDPGGYQLVASLTCERDTCGQSDTAKLLVRNIHLTVADYADPVVTVDPSGLFGGGWLRGDASVAASASDDGIREAAAPCISDDMQRVAADCDERQGPISRDGLSGHTGVAPRVLRGSAMTADRHSRAPFTDGGCGATCGSDFAGNSLLRARTMHVDNARPQSPSRSQQDPQRSRADQCESRSTSLRSGGGVDLLPTRRVTPTGRR